MANQRQWVGDELTQTAHGTFDSRVVQRCQGNIRSEFWIALQSSEAIQCTVSCGNDHMLVSRGYMRAEYPLLMALILPYLKGTLLPQQQPQPLSQSPVTHYSFPRRP